MFTTLAAFDRGRIDPASIIVPASVPYGDREAGFVVPSVGHASTPEPTGGSFTAATLRHPTVRTPPVRLSRRRETTY